MFVRLFAAALFFVTPCVLAAGVEETFLVVRDPSGRLVQMDHASSDQDEQAGIHRYAEFDRAVNTTRSQCFYRRQERPRKLLCTGPDGKAVNRTFVERPTGEARFAALARGLYEQVAKGKLPSSVGSLQDGVFVCVENCAPGTPPAAAIEIECAECGMDEDFCMRRLAGSPKSATVNADDVNLRSSPSPAASVIGRLRRDQLVHVESAADSCSELQGKAQGLVGRWIKVRSAADTPPLVGWVFDPYVRYDTER